MDAEELNLPERINHPAHKHELVLSRHDPETPCPDCCLCMKVLEEGELIYLCKNSADPDCGYKLDIACLSFKALVDFRGHEHPFVFLEGNKCEIEDFITCISCNSTLKDLIFWCVDSTCAATLHLLCGPLPVAIRYHQAGYELNLALKDIHLDGAYPEDSWCDICEEARDPGQCVYRSDDPPFTAAIDCLLPQIVGTLKGDLGEVQLRRVRGHISGVVRFVTAQASIELKESAGEESLVDEDHEEVIEESKIEGNICGTFSWKDLGDYLTVLDEELSDYLKDELRKHYECEGIKPVLTFKFSDEAFELFQEQVAIVGGVDLRCINSRRSMEEDELVKVGDNFVLLQDVPTYRQLIGKHGDFTADSPLSPVGRAVYLMTLLSLIETKQGMTTFHMTSDLLCSCQWFLELLRDKLGFNLQFALDNLEKVARACYALEFIKVRDNTKADLTEKIEQLKREIEDDKDRAQYGRATKESTFAKKFLAEGPKIEWKNAGEFLGLDPEE